MSTQGALVSYSPEYLAQDIGQRLMDASIALIVIITITFALFLVSRSFFAERNSWEIWTLYPVSYILCLVLCISCILFVTVAGAGRHVVYWLDTDPTVIVTFLKIQTADEFIYMAGVTFPKVSILMLYFRIFIDRKVRITTWLVIGVVMGHWVATGIIADFTICQPFAFKWDKTIPGHCTNLMAAYKYISIPNIVTDLAILILPFSTLYRLQMSRTRKIGIALTFLAGSLGIITAIVRFVGFFKADLESDLTYLGVNTMIYTMIEPCAYFICSCLPGTRPLIRAMYRKLRFGSAVSNRYNARAAATKHLGDIPLGNCKGSNKVSVSVPKGPNVTGVDEGRAGFIRLQETVQVDYSSGASA